MSITGNLRTMELSELLQWVARGAKTGTLVINDGRVEKRLVFDRGTIIATASSNPKEYLGHFLVSHGYLDETTLAKAMEMQDANKMLLGKILVTIDAISEPDLDRMLRLKSEEAVYEMFTWPEGEFRFLDGEVTDFRMVRLELEIQPLILEGAHRIDDWKRIRRKIPAVECVPVSVAPLEPPDDDPLAAQILPLVDDVRSVEEIALHAHSSAYQVCRVLHAQLRAGRLKVVEPRRVEVSRPAVEPGSIGPGALLDTAQAHLVRADYERALRYFQAARSLAPDDRKIQRQIERAETTIRRELRRDGISLESVPSLERSLEELADAGLSPQEGFILTRINGDYDIGTILKISPMPSLEALLVFRKLAAAGHITLREA